MQQQSNSIHSSHRNGYYNSHQQQQDEGAFPLIQKMIFYLKQEQLSPALLPFRHQVFNKLQSSLQEQQKKLKLYKNDPESDTTNSIRNYKTVIYSMEIQKISYILKHYLKIRLDKIQKCSFYYTKNKAYSESLMSKPQFQFLTKYTNLRYKFYEDNIFKMMVKTFRGVGSIEMFLGRPQEKRLLQSNQSKADMIEPDMKSYVFARMNRNPKEFMYKNDLQINQVPPEEPQIASTNDILFVPYEILRQLMNRSNEEDFELV